MPFRFLLLATLALTCSRGSAQTVRVAGSDYAAKALELSESGESMDGFSVDYQMTGSLMGLVKLQEGLADVAFIIQTSDGYPEVEDLATIPLGFWGVYFAVNPENPLSEVSKSKLAEVLQKTKDGLKSEFGGLIENEPRWTNRLIFVTYDIEESDPSYPVLLDEFFEREAPENFASMGERIENPYLAGTSNLLVMSHLPEAEKGLRALALVEDDQSVGFPPSAESMFYGDYPVRSTLMLVAKNPMDETVRAFIRHFFENKGMQKLADSGLVAVPENVKKQALLEFDLEF